MIRAALPSSHRRTCSHLFRERWISKVWPQYDSLCGSVQLFLKPVPSHELPLCKRCECIAREYCEHGNHPLACRDCKKEAREYMERDRTCSHGIIGDCNECNIAGDLAYDAARERSVFGR